MKPPLNLYEILIFCHMIFISCSGTDFKASQSQFNKGDNAKNADHKSGETSGATSKNDTERNGNSIFSKSDTLNQASTEGIGIGVSDNETEIHQIISEDEQLRLTKYCVFAVSGALLGYSASGSTKYGTTFPLSREGNDRIEHGDTFDRVGGVYLRASSIPYEYRKGDGAIDLAVDYSFDGISVPPGLHVTIKSGYGDLIFEGEGPFMAFSTTYGAKGNQNAMPKLRSRSDMMPPWMVKYLSEIQWTLPLLPLSPIYKVAGDLNNAHSVLVEKIPGVTCEDY